MDPPSRLVENVLLFGRLLRAAGMDVHHAQLADAIRALEWLGVDRREDVAATLRCLLVHRLEDIARFDQAFALFFAARRTSSPGLPLFSIGERAQIVVNRPPHAAIHAELDGMPIESSPAATRAVGAWSPAGVSRDKDFAEFTESELERARAVLGTLPWAIGRRRTHRWRQSSDGAVHLRSLLRRNLMRGGDLVDLPRRQRREAARPIVFVGDVSGSMERYSRVLLHFVYGLARSGTRIEAFLFATRLTRVTRLLASQRPGPAFTRVAREVQDWGGGTRIGEALRTFNLLWARRVMRNGPVVLIVSDGWDRGDPVLISQELGRVHRSAHRLIWLNPLLGSVHYEPLTRGMQAALQHVDDFLPVHNLASIEQLAEHLRRV
jgi:uncharacterized protein